MSAVCKTSRKNVEPARDRLVSERFSSWGLSRTNISICCTATLRLYVSSVPEKRIARSRRDQGDAAFDSGNITDHNQGALERHLGQAFKLQRSLSLSLLNLFSSSDTCLPRVGLNHQPLSYQSNATTTTPTAVFRCKSRRYRTIRVVHTSTLSVSSPSKTKSMYLLQCKNSSFRELFTFDCYMPEGGFEPSTIYLLIQIYNHYNKQQWL